MAYIALLLGMASGKTTSRESEKEQDRRSYSDKFSPLLPKFAYFFTLQKLIYAENLPEYKVDPFIDYRFILKSEIRL